MASCTESSPLLQWQGKTMGTTYTVKVFHTGTVDQEKIQKQIDEALVQVNHEMSTYMQDSEISKVNREKKKGLYPLSPWFGEVLDFSLKLADKTEGAFDPTIGPLVNLWGFGPKGERKVPKAETIKKIKRGVGFNKLALNQKDGVWELTKKHSEVYIDLSASAKGFGVDKVSELLARQGLVNHLVEIGGEIRVMGKKGKLHWVVAIEMPDETKRAVQKVLKLKDLSLATSGNYRNFFKESGKRYGHTIDQKTGKPVRHNLLSVSILSKTCMEADALATALMAMGPERAKKFAQEQDIAAYFISVSQDEKDFDIHFTPSFQKYTKQP